MKPALIITDMQNDFIEHINNVKRTDQVIKNIQRIKKLFRKNNLPVFYLRFVNTPNNKHVKRFEWDYCLKGSEGLKIIKELKPEESDLVFNKSENSGFYNNDFVETLKKLNIDTLILTGIQTHICVLSTANDGYSHDYEVIVLEDCVTSSSDKKNKFGLWWIDKYVGKVISSSELII